MNFVHFSSIATIDDNARAVFILNEGKFIPFKIFAKKFIALTKDAGRIYDFILGAQIGTVIHGLKVWLNWPKEETNGTINALPVGLSGKLFLINIKSLDRRVSKKAIRSTNLSSCSLSS